jgi:hypothetical protein
LKDFIDKFEDGDQHYDQHDDEAHPVVRTQLFSEEELKIEDGLKT